MASLKLYFLLLSVYIINRNVDGFVFERKVRRIRPHFSLSNDQDPRKMKQKNGQQYRELREELLKQKEASAAMDLPKTPLVQTIAGGENLLFEIARQTQRRWHPDPSAQEKPTSQGYAGTIWKNVRKRQKPVMWKYALRTFDQVTDRTNLHYEGALVACAKLGEWEKSLEIYEEIRIKEAKLLKQSSMNKARESLPTHVSESVVLSVLRACVRGAKKADGPVEERRKALDAAAQLLVEIEEKYEMFVGAHHVNPIAAAFDKLGLYQDAKFIVNANLENRTRGPEPENGPDQFNVKDIKAKDKGSYALLVQGSVSEGDWSGAVDALRDMTEAGLYPGKRHLNRWTEVSERKTKHRTTRGWKKKRDAYWVQRVQ